MDRRNFCKAALAAGAAASFPFSRSIGAGPAALQQASFDIPATNVSSREILLEKATVDELRNELRGSLLTPGSGAYDTARMLWNGMIDKHPALIARCMGAADVAHAVNFARGRDMLVAVKGGGHSFAGKSSCDGGMMIDLSGMDIRCGQTHAVDEHHTLAGASSRHAAPTGARRDPHGLRYGTRGVPFE